MVKAARNIAPAPTVDPIVHLAKDLLVLWDADDGSEHEYFELGTVAEHVRYDTSQQLAEWRDAVEKIITYTKPKTLQSALIQLGLACDTLSDSTLQADDIRQSPRSPPPPNEPNFAIGDADNAACARR